MLSQIRTLMRKHGFNEAADNLRPWQVSPNLLKVWQHYDRTGIPLFKPELMQEV